MRILAAGNTLAGWAMAAAGILLVLSAWTIPYAVEALLALALVYSGLVIAGAAPGPRGASAVVLIVALAVAVMLPASDAAWGLIDRALHVVVGIVLTAWGCRRLFGRRAAQPVPS